MSTRKKLSIEVEQFPCDEGLFNLSIVGQVGEHRGQLISVSKKVNDKEMENLVMTALRRIRSG